MSLVLGIWTGWDRTASGAGFLCWLQEEYKDLVQSRCVHFGQLMEDVMIILTISDKFALEMTWPMLVGREILSATRRWAQPWSNESARSWVFWPNPGKAQGQQSVPWTEVKQDEMGWLQGQEGRKQTENRTWANSFSSWGCCLWTYIPTSERRAAMLFDVSSVLWRSSQEKVTFALCKALSFSCDRCPRKAPWGVIHFLLGAEVWCCVENKVSALTYTTCGKIVTWCLVSTSGR